MVSPQAKRQAVDVLLTEHGFGVTRAGGRVNSSRFVSTDTGVLKQSAKRCASVSSSLRLRSVATAYRRIQVRRRKRKGIGPFKRRPLPRPTTTNQSWSMDFIADGLANGCAVWPAWTTIVAYQLRSLSIMVWSSKAVCWTRGRMRVALHCRSFGQVSPSRMLMSRASMAACHDECLHEHWVESLAHARSDRELAYRLQYRSTRTALWTIKRQSSMRTYQGFI